MFVDFIMELFKAIDYYLKGNLEVVIMEMEMIMSFLIKLHL